jgi:ADP-ribose pyrophosphatase YjhB (NUDIX family)
VNRLSQLGWLLRRQVIGLLHLRTRGVKIMLFNELGELLLIRNSYGDRAAFVLPGGGVGWRENPQSAAIRELREEVGIAEASLRLLGNYESRSEGKRDRVSLYQGTSAAMPRADGLEVAEAAYFPLDALPDRTSAATRRRINEWLAGGPFSGAW